MPFDEVTDVLVLGTGASGCAAAIAAARSGLQVTQLEKTVVLGGSTTLSYGLLWVPGWSDQARTDLPDAVRYLCSLGAGGVSEDEARRYCLRALEAVEFLGRHGVAFESLPDIPDHHYPSAPGSRAGGRIIAASLFDARRLGPWQRALGFSEYVPRGLSWTEVAERGGLASAAAWAESSWPQGRSEGDYRGFGMSLTGSLVLASLDSGVDLRMSHHATRLTVDDGRVTGCQVSLVAEGGGSPQTTTIGARKGVVIATNNIEGSRDLVLRFENLPDWETSYPESCNGEGMLMATEAGAGIRRNHNNFRQKLGYRIPAHAGDAPGFRDAGIHEMAAPHTVVVNRQGRRFADESRFQSVANAIAQYNDELTELRNYPCYLLMDRSFFEDHSFAGRPAGAAPPGWLVRGESLVALARELEIEPEGLMEEIEQFNMHAAEGRDPVFNRGSAPFSNLLAKSASDKHPNLGPLQSPPYFGIPLVPTGKASVALDTDDAGRVLTLRDEPVEGLFACGAAAPKIDRGPGYQAGLGLGQGLAMGCTIGWTMAR